MLRYLTILLCLSFVGQVWAQNAPRAVAVAAGGSHSLFIKNDGVLFAMGLNSAGQLGDGTFLDRVVPVKVASGVTVVAAGSDHSLFLKNDGTLWAMGRNNYGQLGDGTTIDRNTPVQVAPGVMAISAGQSHSLFLKVDGTLWGMGRNLSGQLGLGDKINRHIPVQVGSGVTAFAAGGQHSLFLKTNGALWAMGLNAFGQLGDGSPIDRPYPVQIASDVEAVAAGAMHSLFVKTDGTLWGMGRNSEGELGAGFADSQQTPLHVASGVSAVAAGSNHSLFLKTDGTLWGMGRNNNRQLREPISLVERTPLLLANDVSMVVGGGGHTLYITAAGELWTQGANFSGQLGDVPTVNNRGRGILDLALSITTPPASQTAVVGTPVTFSVIARGVPAPSFQWRKNGTDIAGARDSSLTITQAQSGDAGSYTVVIANSDGSMTSSAATLTVIAGAIVPRQTAIKDKAVSIYADSSGAGTVRWQVSTDRGSSWADLLDGPIYAGTSTPLLEISSVASSLNGNWYRYQVSFQGSLYTSGPAELQVISSPLVMPVGLTMAGLDFYVTDAAAQTIMRVTPELRLFPVAGARGVVGGADGTGETARFNEPTGIFYRADLESVIVADTANATLRSVSRTGEVTTIAGQAGAIGSTDGGGSAARFNAPTGIDTDTFGVYVVVDQANHTIRLVTTGGNVATLAGKAGIPGAVNAIGDNARFNLPTDIVQGRSRGRLNNLLLVSDTGNHTLRTISPDARVETFAGLAGAAGTADGRATEVRFNRPTGVAIDGDGDLYVADTGSHTIRKYTWGNATFVTWAGMAGVSGLMDGDGGKALFNAPEGLAIDGEGNLLVADTGNAAIRRIDRAGVVITLAIQADIPVIASQPSSQSVNAGAVATFSVTATGGSPLSYQWRKDGNAIAGATASTFTIAAVSAVDAGGYSVVVSNPAGSVTSNTATLTVAASTPPPGGGSGAGGSSGGGGGGGAPSIWMLVAVSTLLVLSRKRLADAGQPLEPPVA